MIGGWRFAFGPEVRLNLPPTEVVVQNNGARRDATGKSPPFSVGFTLDIATSLYGSLW